MEKRLGGRGLEVSALGLGCVAGYGAPAQMRAFLIRELERADARS